MGSSCKGQLKSMGCLRMILAKASSKLLAVQPVLAEALAYVCQSAVSVGKQAQHRQTSKVVQALMSAGISVLLRHCTAASSR